MCVRVLGQPPIHRLVLAWQSASIWPTGLTLREFQWRTGTISIRALLASRTNKPPRGDVLAAFPRGGPGDVGLMDREVHVVCKVVVLDREDT